MPSGISRASGATCRRAKANRRRWGTTRKEMYRWTAPSNLSGQEVYLKASLWHRRMPDSHAEHLGIDERPHLLVSQDERRIKIVGNP